MSTLPKSRRPSTDVSAVSSISGNSRTLIQLQRSATARLASSVYEKNMWDDDEYVDTGGSRSGSVTRTPTGGPAARRINQQRKMLAQTAKHPKNPFADPETTEDYADMTGHQRDETGMEELRNTHQYKSIKTRSQSTTRYPSESDKNLEDFDGRKRNASDVDLNRNLSISSSASRTGSQGSRFKRSDTSPVFRTHQNSVTETTIDVQRNGSVGGTQTVIEETDGAGFHVNGQRNMNTMGSSQLPAPSPAHSSVSLETSSTYVKPSLPSTPTVVYKSSSDSNIDSAQVAVVIEETGPKSPMHASFSAHAGSQLSDDKSNLKFETPKPKPKARNIVLITLAVLLILCLIGVIIFLSITVSQQSAEISSLKNEISSLLSASKPETSTIVPTSTPALQSSTTAALVVNTPSVSNVVDTTSAITQEILLSSIRGVQSTAADTTTAGLLGNTLTVGNTTEATSENTEETLQPDTSTPKIEETTKKETTPTESVDETTLGTVDSTLSKTANATQILLKSSPDTTDEGSGASGP